MASTDRIVTITRDGITYFVRRYRVHGGAPLFVHDVYTPSPASKRGGWTAHSSVTTIDGVKGWCGRVGTEELPADLDALPAMTHERSVAVHAWFEERYAFAYALIREAYPGIEGRETMGEIETRS